MENKEQLIEQFYEEYEMLTDEQKSAVCWFIENREIAEKLSKGKKIPDDEMENMIEIAMNKKDYIRLLLLKNKQKMDRNGNE